MYDKLQELWVEKTDLKVGDKVKILKKFEDNELKSFTDWSPEMSETIGEVGEVVGIYIHSIRVDFGDDDWVYPFTVLEKVEIEEKIKPDVPDTNRDVLFFSSDEEWVIGFYCNESGCWKVRSSGIGVLRLADDEVVRWQELPSVKGK